MNPTRNAVLLAALLAGADAVSAQSRGFVPNQKLAEDGMALFVTKGCTGCHTIGQGRTAGPDLIGVTARRDTLWLMKFLEDPPGFAQKDSTARALIEESSGVNMPNLGLTEPERRALLHYLARESARQQVRK